MKRIEVLVSLLVLFSASVPLMVRAESFNIVSSELTDAAGFEISWNQKLPLHRNEKPKEVYYLGGRLYILTTNNFLFSLNGSTGKIVFNRSLAVSGLPIMGLDLYGDRLYSVSGSRLMQLDADLGTTERINNLDVRVVSSPVRNKDFFYFAGVDKRVAAVRADDRVQMFEVAAENDSAIAALSATEDYFVFGTVRGNVVVGAPDEPVKLWQFDAAEAVVGDITAVGDRLFFASKDTNVYSLDVEKKKLRWKYQCSAVLEDGPQVTADMVYQCVPGSGLIALNADDGELLWKVEGGESLLCSDDGVSYVMTANGRLMVMDDRRQRKAFAVNFSSVDSYVANTLDSKMFILNDKGYINCIIPLNND